MRHVQTPITALYHVVVRGPTFTDSLLYLSQIHRKDDANELTGNETSLFGSTDTV